MASIVLTRIDAEFRELPQVCMQCGAPATTRVTREFTWHPAWVWLLRVAEILAALIPFPIITPPIEDEFTNRIKLQAPMCRMHFNHWDNREAIRIVLLLVGVVPLPFGFFLILPGKNIAAGLACLGWVVLTIGWIVLSIILHNRSIHMKQITRTHLTLANVSSRFVDAVAAEHVSEE